MCQIAHLPKRLRIRNQPNSVFALLSFLVRHCPAILMNLEDVVNVSGLIYAFCNCELVRQKLHL
jgi:hypothetical protein